jgi:hypothetical protein
MNDFTLLGDKLAFVREARLLGGREAGRRAWALVNLPHIFAATAMNMPSGDHDDCSFHRWFEDRVERWPGVRTETTDLYDDYVAWRGEHRALSIKKFAMALSACGVDRIYSNRSWRIDVRLRPSRSA